MAGPLTGEPNSLSGSPELKKLPGAEKIAMPKISLAAGLALALYRQLGAEVYLFDTEAERVGARKVVETLLTIRADGGANIGAVMEETMRIDRPDNIYIIVSDGITEADEELTKRFAKYAHCTKLILVPPSREDFQWVKLLKERKNVVYAHDIAQFEKDAYKLLAEPQIFSSARSTGLSFCKSAETRKLNAPVVMCALPETGRYRGCKSC